MDVVTVKFQPTILKRIDKTLAEHNFNSRTEFIREAVRDKLASLNRDELIDEFLKLRGKAKSSTSRKAELKIKSDVGKELMTELEQRFN